MQSPFILTDRRRFIATLALSAGAFTVRGAFAEQLARTVAQTEGPFYPDRLPLDTDNDLIVLNNGLTPAVGEITHLSGRILDDTGAPLRNAIVEIWQCDHEGVYLHSADASRKPGDRNFQGFGRFLTDSSGAYYFRTIKPVPYPGRTPHIHFKVKQGGRDLLTTQCYVKGHPGNAQDGIWKSVTDPRARESITIDFSAAPGSATGELAAKFDIVVGRTPTA
jgi:protocatechuate 3,4-dioxygenase beta subunit